MTAVSPHTASVVRRWFWRAVPTILSVLALVALFLLIPRRVEPPPWT